jgi:hypothetical protein
MRKWDFVEWAIVIYLYVVCPLVMLLLAYIVLDMIS